MKNEDSFVASNTYQKRKRDSTYAHNFQELVVLGDGQLAGVLQVGLEVLDGAVHLLQRLLDRVHGDARGAVDVQQLLAEGDQVGELGLDDVHQIVQQRRLVFGVLRVRQL